MLKWIYSLGVQHERQRIKTAIAGMYVDLNNDIEMFYEQHSDKKPSPHRVKDNDIREAARKMLAKIIEPEISYSQQELRKSIIDGGE